MKTTNEDLVGREFFDWKVIGQENSNPKIKNNWICQCKCGTIRNIRTCNLSNGSRKSCKKCFEQKRIEKVIGAKYGDWTVIDKAQGRSTWICQCKCGFIKKMTLGSVRDGKSTRCIKCRAKFGKTRRKDPQIGDRYGSWTIKEVYIERGDITRCLCICKCGIEKMKPLRELTFKGETCCRKCTRWEGFGEIPKTVWSAFQKSAKTRSLDWNISIEYGWELFLKQERKCALSDLPIQFTKDPHDKMNMQTASIDRIDNKKPYEEGNVQWVHKKMNFMKHVNDQEEFIGFANLVAKKHPRNINPEEFKFDPKCNNRANGLTERRKKVQVDS